MLENVPHFQVILPVQEFDKSCLLSFHLRNAKLGHTPKVPLIHLVIRYK